MSFDTILKAKGVSKKYKIFRRPHERLFQKISRKKLFKEHWALKNISFEVKRGETLGILGKNGSGKSTLLQVICGTLKPTAGKIELGGRVAALLELGAGFDPESTGIENIYTNGLLVGLKAEEIEDNLEDIVRFADIGEFIERPVKTYSSGMFVRLAFAIYAHLKPDIFIIDEALAVGDIAFQAKCIEKLDLMRRDGVTVIFVSHDVGTVRNICDRALFLQNGEILADGPAGSVSDEYVKSLKLELNRSISDTRNSVDTAVNVASDYNIQEDVYSDFVNLNRSLGTYGSFKASIVGYKLESQSGKATNIFDIGESFRLSMFIHAHENINSPVLGFAIRDIKGNQIIAPLTSNHMKRVSPLVKNKRYRIDFVSKNILQQGSYLLSLVIEEARSENKIHETIFLEESVTEFISTYGGNNKNICHAMVYAEFKYNFCEIQ